MADQPAADALRQRYLAERDRRLSPDRGHYTYLDGDLAERFDRDPWAATDGARAPVTREVEVAIAGGGFAGLIAGANLRQHGLTPEDICIIERGSDFGGTWYWNRYPGLSCDTESYIYLPLLEETGYVPSEKYAKGPEIWEHSRRIARQFDLYDGALLQTRALDAQWDEERTRWIVRTDRGDEIRARFLFLCGGGTSRPKLPGIAGITDFKGHAFHTMRWDYGYTGGGPEGNLVNLKDKRVALVGTGASAIQAVPPLAEWAQHLTVFQRTPSAVNVRANRPTDPQWAAQLKPGWQAERMENFLAITSGYAREVDLVDDGWTEGHFNVLRLFGGEQLPHDVQARADIAFMNGVRARVDAHVADRATAEALKPWYGLFCKRPTFHDGFLDTFNRPNVTLVDTQGRGIERITERGIVADGREHQLDCIVFATGFDLSFGMGLNPKGVGGIALTERWTRELSTLHGLHVSEFPNMFVIGGFQSALATTFTYPLQVQTTHCARIVRHCRDKGLHRAEVTAEAARAWAQLIADQAVDVRDYFRACTPGYYNAEGGEPLFMQFYGGGPLAYTRLIDDWFDSDLETDFELR